MTTKGTDKWASGTRSTDFNKATRSATASPQVSVAPAIGPKVMSPSPERTGMPMPGPYRKAAATQTFAEQRARHNAAVAKSATPVKAQAPAPKSIQPTFNAASAPKPMSTTSSKGRSR
ncbi:hypothetical protein SAMN05216567_11426 [Variovorax sp. OK605]|jgi:hypothetical protein|uniref:hypothetical protein n=1 Tax=Variovorax sp. OK605 TaxID=1855317 RepID=UPI0008F39CFF|nr:hypothetical protein [Variovorax sp. OK605]SFQ33012.1 hypothetical protein SAMN05216567_11426 [Variovorax sp. OK605]